MYSNHPHLSSNTKKQIIFLHSKYFDDKFKLNQPLEILILENVDFHTNCSSINFNQEKSYRSLLLEYDLREVKSFTHKIL
jgi:hypothetical protein